MASQAHAYPLPAIKKHGSSLGHWLDSLPLVTQDPELGPPYCYGCTFPLLLPDEDCNRVLAANRVEDRIIALPCHCWYKRGCIEAILSPKFGDDDSCPICGFRFFDKPTLESWILGLEKVDVSALASEDRRCGICLLDYGTEVPADGNTTNTGAAGAAVCVRPVKLSCGHCFGSKCLLPWLSPLPMGVCGNTCPICRKDLFKPWPLVTDSAEGLEDGEIPSGWLRDNDTHLEHDIPVEHYIQPHQEQGQAETTAEARSSDPHYNVPRPRDPEILEAENQLRELEEQYEREPMDPEIQEAMDRLREIDEWDYDQGDPEPPQFWRRIDAPR